MWSLIRAPAQATLWSSGLYGSMIYGCFLSSNVYVDKVNLCFVECVITGPPW